SRHHCRRAGAGGDLYPAQPAWAVPTGSIGCAGPYPHRSGGLRHLPAQAGRPMIDDWRRPPPPMGLKTSTREDDLRKTLITLAVLAMLPTAANAQAPNFDDPAEFAKQREQLTASFNGPADQRHLQYAGDAMVDTAQFKKEGPWTVCFSNAGVNNPWRVVGYTDMTEEVKLHPEIGTFTHVDAEGSDDKQIADIDDLLAGGNCDALIVSPNSTAALTPAVEKACAAGLPVIV